MMDVKKYLTSVLETDLKDDRLLYASAVKSVAQQGEEALFSVALRQKHPHHELLYFEPDEETVQELFFRVRFYSHGILRLLISRAPRPFPEHSPMLELDPALVVQPARLEQQAGGWRIASEQGAFFSLGAGPFQAGFSPDGRTSLEFMSNDQFEPTVVDSLPVLSLDREAGSDLLGFSLHIHPGENFCGTGERFERPNLFGQQIDLINVDGRGVNNPRAYKNIPFLLSSRGYGLFVHSPAKMRLDIGAHSTRALQWLVEDDPIDLFVIGGGSPSEVLHSYRRLTGFPAMPPLWSFGVWMSRASYYSAAEVDEVARRLRAEDYPADVLHLDIGWFRKEWVCDWQFSPETFPHPEAFIRRLDEQGFQVSVWQYPYIQPGIELAQTALREGYVARETASSRRHWLGYTLDFTNPQAVAWYQSLLEPLLRMGAAAIKTDFGEEVDEGGMYAGMSGERLHNLFALLYAKAAWEITEKVRGKGNTLIWARSAWAGSQRYPVHWGGDAAATYDGLAGTLCGGLHFGLSGFAFWSHDVGGIHGIPDFMLSRPSDDLYVRWTQVGVFSSHMRYHGGTPREPWEFPDVAGIVREWLRFRYALLPYILEQAEKCCRTGLPMFRSLIFDWPQDPAVWNIADQYLFGDHILVCPVLFPSGMRSVYLPSGQWVDFWSGQVLSGPLLLPEVSSPLGRLPVYIRYGTPVTFAEPVANTRLLNQARRVTVRFDESYAGYEASPLWDWVRLDGGSRL